MNTFFQVISISGGGSGCFARTLSEGESGVLKVKEVKMKLKDIKN